MGNWKVTDTSMVKAYNSVQAGSYMAAEAPMIVRQRQGLHRLQQVTNVGGGYNFIESQSGRQLNNEQLWSIYLKSPDVRAPIDSIVRRLATWDWAVEPTVDPKDKNLVKAQEAADTVTAFLKKPTIDGKTWQEVMTEICLDLLVFDAGVAEIVKTRGGGISELVPYKGCDFVPEMDEHGTILGYFQQLLHVSNVQDLPHFDVEDVLYLKVYSNTSTPLGLPLIDSLVNEVVALMMASEHAMKALDADEIPPGILVLGGIADEAVIRAKADLQNMKGRDHRLRILNNPMGGEVSAKWVELQRDFKDVAMIKVVENIRRTIWRAFGVSPVEMGSEEAPKSAAEAQLDVSSSHLITPILELIQAKINAQIIPLLVGEDEQGLVAFGFDLHSRLSEEDKKFRSERHTAYVAAGILKLNEIRAELGYRPVEGGDINRTEVGGLLVPVDQLENGIQGGFNDTPASFQEDAEEVMGVENEQEEEGAEAEAAAASKPLAKFLGLTQRESLAAVADDLPSDWQLGGRFADFRTLDLPRLAGVVAEYSRRVEPFWDEMATEIEVAFAAELTGGLTEEGKSRLRNVISKSLHKLADKWAFATGPLYMEAGQIGVSAARDISGAQVLEKWQDRSDVYQLSAMGYLTRTDSPLAEVSRRLLGLLSASLAIQVIRQEDGSDDQEGVLLAAVGLAIASQVHRIKNWAGRLVELANDLLVAGLGEVDQAEAGGTKWYAEWVALNDKNTCTDCGGFSALGIIPLVLFSTRPGGATACRAKCRCVLSIWTAEEVRDGVAGKVP